MTTPTQEKGTIINDQAAGNITRVEELAYELKVGEVMTRNVKTLLPSMLMTEVLEIFRRDRISGAPVLENGKLVGVLSIEDVIRCLIDNNLKAPVSEYMTPDPICVKETDPVIEGLKTFVSTTLGRLIVINEEGELIGIITKGDITRGFLKTLQHDFHTEEIKRYRASHLFEDIESDRSSLILRYNIKARDFTHGGTASSNIKRALLRLGASPQIARRVGIAVYEAEMNLIIHTTSGGVIRVEIESNHISIDIYDYGPGIPDVDLAMKPGYSTAPETIRELGFGAGMGLINIARCVDHMKLESVFGKGTRLRIKIDLESQETVGEGYFNKEQIEP